MHRSFSLINACIGLGASHTETSEGPTALRSLGLLEALLAHGVRARDGMEVVASPASQSNIAPTRKAKQLSSILDFNERLCALVYREALLGRHAGAMKGPLERDLCGLSLREADPPQLDALADLDLARRDLAQRQERQWREGLAGGKYRRGEHESKESQEERQAR